MWLYATINHRILHRWINYWSCIEDRRGLARCISKCVCESIFSTRVYPTRMYSDSPRLDWISIWKTFSMSINTSIYASPLRYIAKIYDSFIIFLSFLLYCLSDVSHKQILNWINNLFHSYVMALLFPLATTKTSCFQT